MDLSLLPAIYMIGKILADAIQWEGVAGNFQHDFIKWCATKAGVPKLVTAIQSRLLRQNKDGSPPLNHDIQRAARRAMLKSTLAFDFFWEIDRKTQSEPTSPWTAKLRQYLQQQIEATFNATSFQPPTPIDGQEILLLEENPDTTDWLLKTMIAELASLPSPQSPHGLVDKSFEHFMKSGWVPKPLPVSMQSVMSSAAKPTEWLGIMPSGAAILTWQATLYAYFLKELKEENLLFSIVDTQLLVDLRREARKRDRDFALSMETATAKIEESLQRSTSEYSQIVVQLAQLADKLDELGEQRSPITLEHEIEKSIRAQLISQFRPVRLLGLPGAHDMSQVDLDTIFVQPTIQKRDTMVTAALTRANSSGDQGSETYFATKTARSSDASTIADALERSQRIIIIGKPGSGKTSLLRYLCLKIGQGSTEEFGPSVSSSSIPILVAVRSLETGFKKLPSLIDLLELLLPTHRGCIPPSYALELFRTGKAILLIDGLDECELPSGELESISLNSTKSSEWKHLMKWLHAMAIDFPNLRIVATTRPVGYSRDSSIQGFEAFDIYHLCPLTRIQQDVYIDHWCNALANVERKLSGQNSVVPTSNIANQLSEQVRKNSVFKTLAETPITLSILCLLQARGELRQGEQVGMLLSRCIDALLYDFRNAVRLTEAVREDFAGKLNAEKQRALLEPLAYAMLEQGVQSMDEQSVLASFAKRLPDIDHRESASEVLKSIRDRGGVLVEIAPHSFSFAHLLFQEFLAGRDCARRRATDFLLERASAASWQEAIPFAASELHGAQESLILGLLHKGHEELAARVLNECVVLSRQVRAEVIEKATKLANKYPVRGIPTLLTINNSDAAARFIDLLKKLEIKSELEVFENSTKNETSSPWSAASLARNTAIRCLNNYILNIHSEFAGSRMIGFDSDFEESDRLSWRYASLSISDQHKGKRPRSKAEHIQTWSSNPIYCFAVMLDTLDQAKGCDDRHLKEGLEQRLAKSRLSASYRLLMILLISYRVATRDSTFLPTLLFHLSEIPGEIAPAVQIGIINYSMKRFSNSISEETARSAKELWLRAAIEIESKVTQLVRTWNGGNGPEDGDHNSPEEIDGRELAPDEREAIFRESFWATLNARRPFEFETPSE